MKRLFEESDARGNLKSVAEGAVACPKAFGLSETSRDLWYAIRVKSHQEKIVSVSLEGRGYQPFLPTYQSSRCWSDRVKNIELPLFPGYVFSKFNFEQRLPLLKIPGVVHVVSFGKMPTPVEEHEIAAIQAIVRSGAPAAPWPFLKTGQLVRIEKGSLKDIEGILIKVKNAHRIVVSVTLLQRSVSVEVDRDSILPLSPRR